MPPGFGHCRKCDREHYNFDPCEGPKIHSPPEQLRRPREGLVDVGNRMLSSVVIAGNVYGTRRKPMHEETR